MSYFVLNRIFLKQDFPSSSRHEFQVSIKVSFSFFLFNEKNKKKLYLIAIVHLNFKKC
jgi:hypothetical protein